MDIPSPLSVYVGSTLYRMNGMLSVTSRTVTNYEEAGAPVSQTAALADALQIMPSFYAQ
jgi:hypothetical protein